MRRMDGKDIMPSEEPELVAPYVGRWITGGDAVTIGEGHETPIVYAEDIASALSQMQQELNNRYLHNPRIIAIRELPIYGKPYLERGEI